MFMGLIQESAGRVERTHALPLWSPAGRRRKALVVVCHWDDEIISAWGAMVNFESTVVCLTDKNAGQYEGPFNQVVTATGGQPISWRCPVRDHHGNYCQLRTGPNLARLAVQFKQRDYQFCLTHHFNRDIGRHRQHPMAAALCYDALVSVGLERTIQLFGFGSDRCPPIVPLPEALWFGRDPFRLPIDPESKRRRLELARLYKPDFEARYPIILEDEERHYPVAVRGRAHRRWLECKYGAALSTRALVLGMWRRVFSRRRGAGRRDA